MIFGDRMGLKVPDICIKGEEKTPKNTSLNMFNSLSSASI